MASETIDSRSLAVASALDMVTLQLCEVPGCRPGRGQGDGPRSRWDLQCNATARVEMFLLYTHMRSNLTITRMRNLAIYVVE